MKKSLDPFTRRLTTLVLAATCLGIGPCGPIPGGALSGDPVDAAVRDWSFANHVPRCAVEVRPDSPHSVTVNCMSREKRLFVSCSKCAGKRWSDYVLEDPRGRIRIGENVYPVALRRVEAPPELDLVWQARAAKIGEDAPGPRPEGWWTFELTSR